jgi:hypothetical protein
MRRREERDWRTSERASTGHRIYLPTSFRRNPICPHHGKRAILCEFPDELGCRRWFCIDCVVHAIYDRR